MKQKDQIEYYQALLAKDSNYEGVFFVGVKSTGIFCRPVCPARKPKYNNCEFFHTAEEALLASYRPCKRCQPLSHPSLTSPLVQQLVSLIEENPEKRWRDADLRALSIDASTARRQFIKRFGMTFIDYARARRMGIAMKQIRQGEKVINAQIDAGYESGSGFRDAFAQIMGLAPQKADTVKVLYASWIDTPLGPMVAFADEAELYLLEFVDRRGLEREVERLRKRSKVAIVPGASAILDQIKHELQLYFNGELTKFKTPIKMLGSDFQQSVWQQLMAIPAGETRSYLDIAKAIGNPKACRAVARANGSNQLAIIIPCHRVINEDGRLGGYGGGVKRKEWMLKHEMKNRQGGLFE